MSSKQKNEEHEAERIVAELIAHRFSRKTKYKDYAILYRGNHQSRLLEKVLMQNRIPYKISGGTSFFLSCRNQRYDGVFTLGGKSR